MPFAVAAAGVAAAGTVAGSMLSANATEDAANKSVGEQQRQYNQTRQDLSPWLNTGQTALGQVASLDGLNGPDAAAQAMSTFQGSPGYAYQVQQGLRAVDAGAASRGILNSGATIKAEETLGSNLANQNFTQYYNQLAGIAGAGQSAANGLGTFGAQSAAGQAQTLASLGSSQASIYGNAANGLTNAATGYLTNSKYQNQLAGYGYGAGSDPFAGASASSSAFGGTSDAAFAFGA